ncbi:SOS response-associated peptidase [Oleiagrimonas sp. C23AA]|uniref:SOS response-associated peptidase n=1 Tax=Oleiagrimonas sp. C23AA TaxID=2719047 RepID=UPI001421CE3B|nr:SOS response-associated peptidase [Oleiagrimonas sp. C23AA]NII10664.1 SOS response-associated peptidase [Oleiagrimonas sp. C23AA]
MCGRFARYAPIDLSPEAEAALRDMDPQLDLAEALNQREPQYNIAPTMTAAVMARNADARLEVKGLRWGLVPSWAKDTKIASAGINARMETVAEKPMFRAAFKKRRCIVPMSGYFEWKQLDNGKQPYFIHAPDRTVLLCAGIWEAWRPKGDESAEGVRTFAVLTGAAGVVSGNIHDRQPVILPPDRLCAWIDGTPDDARALLQQLPEASLEYYPVSKKIGAPRNQGQELVAPIS